ncbi:MAG: flagellar hook basal-body protein [bacterium]
MPINPMSTAANALRYWERRQEVTANNLANVSTDGFKAERVFGKLLDGVTAIGTKTDRRDGVLRQTGEARDLGMAGDGFFVVNTPAGERFTRGGSMKVDLGGYLTDSDGNQLLGQKGAIKVGDNKYSVDRQGTVEVDGHPVDQLRVETTPANAELTHEGGTRFVPDSTRSIVPPGSRDIRQGTIEESNADSLGGLVDMISIQRAYSSVEKTISVLDHVNEVATSQLGRAAN